MASQRIRVVTVMTSYTEGVNEVPDSEVPAHLAALIFTSQLHKITQSKCANLLLDHTAFWVFQGLIHHCWLVCLHMVKMLQMLFLGTRHWRFLHNARMNYIVGKTTKWNGTSGGDRTDISDGC